MIDDESNTKHDHDFCNGGAEDGRYIVGYLDGR